MSDGDFTIARGPRVVEAPRVSVVIPAYRAPFLDEALASVRAQTFAGYEIIVVDDGSPEPIAPSLSDDLVRVRHANAGPGGARNRGFSLARGELVALLDSDDRWHPEKLARQVSFHERRPECAMSCTDVSVRGGRARPTVRQRGDARGEQIPYERLFHENCICCSTVMMRRDALARTPGMAPHRRMGEDYGLWLRLGLVGAIGYLEAPLAERRVHDESLMQETLRDGTWFDAELAVYREILDEHPELRDRAFARAALARVYFEGGYHHLQRGEFGAARNALVQSLRREPTRAKAWIDLARALFHVRPDSRR